MNKDKERHGEAKTTGGSAATPEELGALVGFYRDTIGYYLLLPKVTSPKISQIDSDSWFYRFDDSFDFGRGKKWCGGYGIGGDCPTAGRLFDFMIEADKSNCVEYWGEIISNVTDRRLSHEVYYDLGAGFAGGQIGDAEGLDGKDIEHLLVTVARRLVKSVGLKANYTHVTPMAAQSLLLLLERDGMTCTRCDAKFDRIYDLYTHKCGELITLQEMLYDVTAAKSNQEKKKTLEKFVQRIIKRSPGLSITAVDDRGMDNEVDIKVANESNDPFLRTLGTPIFFECRNVSESVSASSIRDFGGKLRDEGIKTGIIVARKGVTGKEKSDAKEGIRMFRSRDGVNLLVLTDVDLILLVNGRRLSEILRNEFHQEERRLSEGMKLPTSRDELPYNMAKYFAGAK